MTHIDAGTLRALVYSGGPVELAGVDEAELGPSDLRVKVLACGVCGTDLEMLAGRAFVGRLPLPVRPGHEVAGRIIEMGPNAVCDAAGSDLGVGDMIVLHSIGACGSCGDCATGHDNRCRRAKTLGLDQPGGFSDELVWPAARVVRIRDVSATQAALLPDAVATAFHALACTDAPDGGRLAVIGVGGLGTHLLQLACITRPDLHLVGVGRSEQSLQRARSLGAVAISGLDEAARAEARKLGWFDAVVDVSGADASIDFGLSVLKRGGTLVAASVHEGGLQTSMSRTAFMTKELRLVGSYGSGIAELCAVAQLAETGTLDLSGSVSRIVSLEQFPALLPELLERGQGDVRTVVVPDPRALA